MEYLLHLAILFSIFGIFALSLDLIAGYTGLFSLAQAAFYGIGAYTTALLMADAGVNFFVALVLGITLAAVVAFVIGFVFSGLRGDYYILGTVGFNFIIFTVFLNWQSLTGGPLGVAGIARPELFGFSFSSSGSFFLLSLATLAVAYGVSWFIVRSSFGRVLRAIREDEEAIAAFGYHTLYFKLAIFVISAGMAACGGALLASYLSFIDPNTFGITSSIFLLSIIVLGGLGSLRGPVLGALVLILLPEALRFVGFPDDIAAELRQVLYGLLLVFLMLYRPQGFLGEFKL